MDKNEPISHHDVEKLNEALARKDVAYLFIGKGAAVLHGFPDTTQDVDIFPRKDAKNAQALIEALTELGFTIDSATAGEIARGKDFVQIPLALALGHSSWSAIGASTSSTIIRWCVTAVLGRPVSIHSTRWPRRTRTRSPKPFRSRTDASSGSSSRSP